MFIEQRIGRERIIVKAEQLLELERDQSFKDSEERQVVRLTYHPPRHPPRMPYKISCFVPGDHSTFPVNIDGTEFVEDLKQKIKAQKPQGLANVNTDTLTLYQATLGESYDEEKRINELKQLSQTLNGCTELDEEQLVSVYFDRSPPGKVYYTLVQVTEAKKRSDIHQTGTKPELIFRLRKRGTDHFTEDMLIDNDILRHQPINNPEFVSDILAKLQTKKFIPVGLRKALELSTEHDVIAERFNLVTESDNRCSAEEIAHLVFLFTMKIGHTSLDTDAVKHRVGSDYFVSIAAWLCKCYPDQADFKRDAQWPLKFVAEITAERNKHYSYKPRSDFLFSLDCCPRINIGVYSDANHETDRYRLLLQAGLLVRAMNTIKTQGSSFVSVAIYISEELSANWYLVYQPDRAIRTIRYTHQDFDLKLPLGRLEFFRRLYNFPSAFPPGDNITDIKDRLAKLNKHVDTKGLDGFTTPPTKRPKIENKVPPGEDHTHHLDNPSTSQMLSNAGYELLPEIEMEGWIPLNPLPSTVCRARGPPSKDSRVDEKLIFKFVEQDEFDMHSFLLECKLSENHTVPILESFTCPCGLGKLIAMKDDWVLRDATSLFKTAGHSLTRQFLEGVRFLHHNLVAHLDLKPDNIVIGANNRLRIIDFSVSVRVPLLESQIEGYQGTKGWVAPEVAQNTDAGYQPIRADLWSTGQVMRYIARHLPTHRSEIELLADQLQNSEPQQRPLLSTISLDTLFQPPLRYQENLPLKLKRKLSADAQGKEEVKRTCASPRHSMSSTPPRS